MRNRILLSLALLALTTSLAHAEGNRQGGRPGRGDGAVKAACEADVKSLCAGVQPGDGRLIACMRQNHEKLSEGCKSAIAAAKARREAGGRQRGRQGGQGNQGGQRPQPPSLPE